MGEKDDDYHTDEEKLVKQGYMKLEQKREKTPWQFELQDYIDP